MIYFNDDLMTLETIWNGRKFFFLFFFFEKQNFDEKEWNPCIFRQKENFWTKTIDPKEEEIKKCSKN